MTSSDGPIADRVKSITFLKRFYKSPLTYLQSRGNEAENDLTAEFYKSMVGYVVDSMEPLSLNSPPDNVTSPEKSETAAGELANGIRMEYSSGNVFEGQVSNYMPHGIGRLFIRDGGITYQGQFRDGFPDGDGVVRWPDGGWYEGQFRRGLRHGRGLHVSAEDGRRWHGGRWARGKRHGPGETACAADDGALDYAGDWADGRPHGRGAARWPDGTRYDGDWARGLPHGRGRAVWPDGDVSDGGGATRRHSEVYDGDWADGRMDGTGAYEWTSNADHRDRLVLCLCDRYSGQWSRSRKHGPGVFYSSETGTTVRGRWTDDALDGPCEIVLSDGRRPGHSDLRFRQNVLCGTPPATAPAPAQTGVRRGGGTRFPSARPSRRLPPAPAASRSRRTQETVTDARAETTYDLTGHVRRTAAVRAVDDGRHGHGVTRDPVPADASAVDRGSELLAARSAVDAHAARLERLYRAYGAFLADGPVDYRPLMTRLGLWQMVIDSGLHARVSLADFDDLLYENSDYAFGSAHDPFEPVYPWQFVHAVCELAVVVARDDVNREDCRSSAGEGSITFATALHKLVTEYLSADDVDRPKSYASAADGSERWMNSRKTIARMYEVYRAMTTTTTTTTTPTTANDSPALPTARQLIRLYGPRACGGRPTASFSSSAVSPPPPSLDSVLPTVLDAVLATRDEQDDDGLGARAPSAVVLFECSVRSVVALLSEACPRIADRVEDATAAAAEDAPALRLVDVETRLTFAEWYRFVLLCVRRCRHRPVSPPSR